MEDVSEEGKKEESVPETAGVSLEQLSSQIAALQDKTASLEKQLALLPQQVRMVGAKVDSLTTSVAESRLRALLLGLLNVYDLIDQVLRTPPEKASDADLDHISNYKVLHSQLRLLLEANGLSEIPAGGLFDPQIHRALQSVQVADPEMNDRVVEVVRPGFRTEQSILRYAEVVVGRCIPDPAEDKPGKATEQA